MATTLAFGSYYYSAVAADLVEIAAVAAMAAAVTTLDACCPYYCCAAAADLAADAAAGTKAAIAKDLGSHTSSITFLQLECPPAAFFFCCLRGKVMFLLI